MADNRVVPPADEDRGYFLGRWGIKGLQAGCLLGTPVYAVQAIRKGRFSLRSFLRYNWVTPLAGAGVGAGVGAAQMARSGAPDVSTSANVMRKDANRVRNDDLHLIGSVVGALTIPAILIRRAGFINLVLGGAGLGGAGGILTHYWQSSQSTTSAIQGQQPQQQIKGMVNQAREKGEEVVDKAEGVARDVKGDVEKRLG